MRYVKGTEKPPERCPSGQNWNNFGNKINKVILDYNPKCNTGIKND